MTRPSVRVNRVAAIAGGARILALVPPADTYNPLVFDDAVDGV